MIKTVLMIGAGSFLGGVGRYLISQWVQAKFLSSFPLGTLVVNVVGCFLIGIVFGLNSKYNVCQAWQLFLTTGILGGFTTYSAFSVETVGLMKQGQFGLAMSYVALSLLLGFGATFGGWSLVKVF